MRLLADVWVQVPTKKKDTLFTYEIPTQFSFISSGWRVVVPFGNRKVEGVILSTSPVPKDTEFEYEPKKIENILDDSAFYSPIDIKLAEWFAHRYFATIGDALKLFVPGGKEGRERSKFSLNPEFDTGHFQNEELVLVEWIQKKGSVSLDQVKKHFGETIVLLVMEWSKKKILLNEKEFYRVSRVRKEYWYSVTSLGSEILLADKAKGINQRKLLELLRNSSKEKKELSSLGISLATLKNLLGKKWIDEAEVLENPSETYNDKLSHLHLNNHQQEALSKIEESQSAHQYGEYLLYGLTGSGKTEIYLQATEKALSQNQGVIVLIPEIALTGQSVKRFSERFGNEIAIFHSGMSLGEKRTSWKRVQKGEASIVIGARSALFAPVKNVGLIILDEEHEFTYKQEEFPRYHARDVARERARLENGVLLLGSATPALESYYRTQIGEATLLSLPERIGNSELPEVLIVDMREELKRGNRSIFSIPLQGLISETLEKNEQCILLMNRRGYSTFVMCRECGYVAECPDCHISMVYHQGRKTLECHYCHRSESVPDICPSCGSTYIKFFGSGTEKVEEFAKAMFPSARIARLDRDTTSRKGAAEEILESFRSGKIDILIGTQMVAKGHDIPNVTAIGVISADTVLHMPDFRATEQTFSLLTQVAGRAGRGNLKGKVVVQTYSANEPAILDAAKQDYIDFASRELEERRSLANPPFSSLFKVTIYHSSEDEVRKIGFKMMEEFLNISDYVEALGPYPEILQYQRTQNRWYQNILLKTEEPEKLTEQLYLLREKYLNVFVIDRDPVKIF